MDERRVNIDEFFRREMENKAEAPPHNVWDALEKRLDNPPGRKKPLAIWWFWTIAGLIFLSATGIIAGYMTSDDKVALSKTALPSSEADLLVKKHITTDAELVSVDERTEEFHTSSGTISAVTTSEASITAVKKQHITTTIENNINQKNNPQVTIGSAKNESIVNNTSPSAAIGVTDSRQDEFILPLQNAKPQKINNGYIASVDVSAAPIPVLPRQKDEVDILPVTNPATNVTSPAIANSGKLPTRLPLLARGKDDIEMLAATGENTNIMKTNIVAAEKVTTHLPALPRGKDEIDILSANGIESMPMQNTIAQVSKQPTPIPVLPRTTDELKKMTIHSIDSKPIQTNIADASFFTASIPLLPRTTDGLEVLATNIIVSKNVKGNITKASKQAVPMPTLLRTTDDLETLPLSSTGAILEGPKISAGNKKSKSLPATLTGIDNTISPVSSSAVDNTRNNLPVANNLSAMANKVAPASNNAAEIRNSNETAIAEKTIVVNDTTETKSKNADKASLADDGSSLPPNAGKKKINLVIEAGIKAGLSRGLNNTWNANKFIIAPYVECKLPSKFSLIFQPSYQTGSAKTGKFDRTQSYYEVTGTDFDSDERVVRGKVDSSIITPNPPDTVFRNYYYSQQYDSIRVTDNLVSKRQWDIEMPLIVKYQISKNIAVLAGGSVTYSSALETREEVQRYTGLSRTFIDAIAPETFYVTTQGEPPPVGPAPKEYDDVFIHNSSKFDNYQPMQVTKANNFFRYGFMIGATATFSDRWMVDVMLHKTGVNKNAVQDKQLQKIYNQPYIRLTVGYKLLK